MIFNFDVGGYGTQAWEPEKQTYVQTRDVLRPEHANNMDSY